MTVTINGTNGVTTPSLTSTGAITGDGISFADNAPSNSLVVNSSGNVGIGTSLPVYKLDVNNPSSYVTVGLRQGGTLYGYLEAGSSQVKLGTNAAIPLIYEINGSEKARIDSSGNLLVGTTSYGGAATAKFVSQMDGAIGPCAVFNDTEAGTGASTAVQFRRSSTLVGTISVTGTTTAYNTSSDYRLKENIQPMQNALSVVQQLNPVTYTWKADGSDGQGFIAHELQAVVPDCVTGEKDAVDAEGNPVYQGIDTSFLVATLCKAIQELSNKVDAQQAEIDALKGAQA